jgi:hypothetical protein
MMKDKIGGIAASVTVEDELERMMEEREELKELGRVAIVGADHPRLLDIIDASLASGCGIGIDVTPTHRGGKTMMQQIAIRKLEEVHPCPVEMGPRESAEDKLRNIMFEGARRNAEIFSIELENGSSLGFKRKPKEHHFHGRFKHHHHLLSDGKHRKVGK